MDNLLEFARDIVKGAGDELRDQYKKRDAMKFRVKEKGQIVSEADMIADRMIIEAIKKQYPEHSILSEESGNIGAEKSEFVWVVDPLDGSTNFALDLHFWNCTVALVRKGEPVIGVVYAPMYEQEYWAVAGKGAYLNDSKISVSGKGRFEEQFHAFCYGSRMTNAREIAGEYCKRMIVEKISCRQIGAAALELARVASGTLGSMFLPGANPWDVAAGALLVKEAGGVVVDLEGNEWDLNSKSVVAGIQSNVDEILSRIV